MKWTSSSRWAQDRTQNSPVNFSFSNPAPSLFLPRFVWSFRVLFFLPNVEDVVALWPDTLALLRSDIGARRADGGGPCPCWTPDYFIHASKLHIQAFTLKHEAKQTESKQTRRQKCPIHFSPSLSTDFFFFHSLRATLSLVCPLLLLFYLGVVFRSSSHTGPPTLSGGGRGGEPT